MQPLTCSISKQTGNIPFNLSLKLTLIELKLCTSLWLVFLHEKYKVFKSNTTVIYVQKIIGATQSLSGNRAQYNILEQIST